MGQAVQEDMSLTWVNKLNIQVHGSIMSCLLQVTAQMKVISSGGVVRTSIGSVTMRYGDASYVGDRYQSAAGANHHDIIHKVILPNGVTQHHFRMFQHKNNPRQHVVSILFSFV